VVEDADAVVDDFERDRLRGREAELDPAGGGVVDGVVDDFREGVMQDALGVFRELPEPRDLLAGVLPDGVLGKPLAAVAEAGLGPAASAVAAPRPAPSARRNPSRTKAER
jgi:hypothetical protein